ncbi:MAG: RNA pyrophosphohydrolase [Rhodospirillales bacterium]|nr:MAG: RNA pyrophosphohydrolase [Rhodospirillales bacterium]
MTLGNPTDLPYRKGVGALLFDRRGRVLVAQRVDTPGAWQLPQGGIDEGEDPEEAVRREVKEELGTDRFEIVAETPGWLRYDLPEALQGRIWGGRYRGQEQRWYALRFTGADADINLAASGHPEFDAWRWAAVDELPALAVWFKRPLYEDLVSQFRHLGTAASTDLG